MCHSLNFTYLNKQMKSWIESSLSLSLLFSNFSQYIALFFLFFLLRLSKLYFNQSTDFFFLLRWKDNCVFSCHGGVAYLFLLSLLLSPDKLADHCMWNFNFFLKNTTWENGMVYKLLFKREQLFDKSIS